ncbi:MAG: amidohydrolase family protein [Gemmataceae bacterium]
MLAFVNGTLVLPNRLVPRGTLLSENGRITAIGRKLKIPSGSAIVDCLDQYVSPGFVDVHVHGGAGADFMDLTVEAFRTVARCHARHGTTSLTPTSSTGPIADSLRFLELCQELMGTAEGGARILGGHLYGPYFAKPARGCHPSDGDFLTPAPENWEPFFQFACKGLHTLTVAAELDQACDLIAAGIEAGVRMNVGHIYATFDQVERAMRAGVRHVDHLFCAMSDRARLRQSQAFPMRAGVMEATVCFPALSTEVIADGWHLDDSLLRAAYLLKGEKGLCLVTDAMRAVDMPDGEYWFGPKDRGTLIRRWGDVGVTLDGTALASSVIGMDHAIRIMTRATGAKLPNIIRMASLNPARMLALHDEIGSLEVGKRADVITLNDALCVERVFVGGEEITFPSQK